MFKRSPGSPISVVTGAAGFLGSHLSDRLLAEGHRVIGIDNLITGNLANIEHLGANENFAFIKHDVSSFIVLEGQILFQTEQGDFLLSAGQGIVIPKGLRHCPKAADDGPMPLALIIERAETKRLGD